MGKEVNPEPCMGDQADYARAEQGTEGDAPTAHLAVA